MYVQIYHHRNNFPFFHIFISPHLHGLLLTIANLFIFCCRINFHRSKVMSRILSWKTYKYIFTIHFQCFQWRVSQQMYIYERYSLFSCLYYMQTAHNVIYERHKSMCILLLMDRKVISFSEICLMKV